MAAALACLTSRGRPPAHSANGRLVPVCLHARWCPVHSAPNLTQILAILWAKDSRPAGVFNGIAGLLLIAGAGTPGGLARALPARRTCSRSLLSSTR